VRRGGAFYDLPGVLERCRGTRPAGVSDPNVVMEEPALLEALGPVEGLRVADLGCGDAALGRVVLDAGCARYLGIDGSERMVEVAHATLRGTAGEVERGDIEDFAAPPGAFDLVVARMALHYVEDVGRVLSACRFALAPGGRVVLTVIHPVITSHDARASTDELRADWVVDDYFAGGPRELDWLGAAVVWHHRTIEAYVTALQGAGFALTALSECPPRRERFAGDNAEFARRSRIPMFLLLAGDR
jgi:SAM-dependent methyltransferase